MVKNSSTLDYTSIEAIGKAAARLYTRLVLKGPVHRVDPESSGLADRENRR